MQPDQLLALGKVAEAIGTVAVLLIAAWFLAMGKVIPRPTMTDILNHRDKRLDEQIKELREEIRDLKRAVDAMYQATGRCRLINEWIKASKKGGDDTS